MTPCENQHHADPPCDPCQQQALATELKQSIWEINKTLYAFRQRLDSEPGDEAALSEIRLVVAGLNQQLAQSRITIEGATNGLTLIQNGVRYPIGSNGGSSGLSRNYTLIPTHDDQTDFLLPSGFSGAIEAVLLNGVEAMDGWWSIAQGHFNWLAAIPLDPLDRLKIRVKIP